MKSLSPSLYSISSLSSSLGSKVLAKPKSVMMMFLLRSSSKFSSFRSL